MVAASTQRKVLIVEDRAPIRNVLYVLLAGMGCDGAVASTGRQALAMIGHENFDAILLDLRSHGTSLDRVISGIEEIRPQLVGRVLVITGEVADRETMQLLERHALPRVSPGMLGEELWAKLRALFAGAPSPHHTS